jgi:hypothetical protein
MSYVQKMILHRSKFKLWPYLVFFVFLVFLLILIKPAQDDWNQTKYFYFRWQNLLPGTFWRPLEALFGGFTGIFPNAFPFIHHLVVALGHVVAIYFLEKLCWRAGIKNQALLFSILFFAISSGVVAAVYSVDGASQVWALTLGVIAMTVFIEKKGIIKYIGWLFLSTLATFSKESGIVWFVVVPLFSIVVNNHSIQAFYHNKIQFKRFWIDLLIGIIFSITYLSLRVLIKNDHILGVANPTERYSLNLAPWSIIQNFVMLLGTSITSINTIDIFIPPRNYFLLILSIVLNIPFLLMILFLLFKKIKGKQNMFTISVLLLIIVVVSSPPLITKTWEIHAYPTVFAFALIFGVILNRIEWKALVKIVILLFFISSIITNTYKWICIYKYGVSGDQLAKSIVKQSSEIPVNVLLIWVDRDKHYSVYVNQPVQAFGMGEGIKRYYNWEYPKKIDKFAIDPLKCDNTEFVIKKKIIETGEKYDAVWIIDGSAASVIKKRNPF